MPENIKAPEQKEADPKPPPDSHKISEKSIESHVGLSGGGISDWFHGEQGEQYI